MGYISWERLRLMFIEQVPLGSFLTEGEKN